MIRTPGLASEFKQALIDLEDNVDSVRYSDILTTIKKETEAASRRFVFQIEKEILAEATVCAVVAANIYDKRKKKSRFDFLCKCREGKYKGSRGAKMFVQSFALKCVQLIYPVRWTYSCYRHIFL